MVIDSKLRKRQLDIRVGPAPDQRQPCRPIFTVKGCPRSRVFFWWQNASRRRKLRPSHLPAYCGGSNSNLRIVANTFGLAHIAARHHIKPVAFFSEPYRSRNPRAALTERNQGNVFLTADLRRNCSRHACYCNRRIRSSGRQPPWLSSQLLPAVSVYPRKGSGISLTWLIAPSHCQLWFAMAFVRLLLPTLLC